MTLVPRSFASIFALIIVLSAGTVVADTSAPIPRISVVGEGRAVMAPDMAVMTLTVTREGKTAREALNANSEAMGEVIKSMRSEGVAERDLQTSRFSIQPKYIYPKHRANETPSAPRIVGYTVRNSLTVRVRDLKRVGVLLDQSVSLGVNEGGDIQFTNDNPANALREARIIAVKNARAKAETLASAAGVGLGDILDISETSRSSGPRSISNREMAMSRAADSVPVAAGENSYTVRVNLAYAIDQ